jgi:hypothetical protein
MRLLKVTIGTVAVAVALWSYIILVKWAPPAPQRDTAEARAALTHLIERRAFNLYRVSADGQIVCK